MMTVHRYDGREGGLMEAVIDGRRPDRALIDRLDPRRDERRGGETRRGRGVRGRGGREKRVADDEGMKRTSRGGEKR